MQPFAAAASEPTRDATPSNGKASSCNFKLMVRDMLLPLYSRIQAGVVSVHETLTRGLPPAGTAGGEPTRLCDKTVRSRRRASALAVPASVLATVPPQDGT